MVGQRKAPRHHESDDETRGGQQQSSGQARVVHQEHLALVKGDISGTEPVMVRMHAVDLLDDMTGAPHWIAIHNAMHMISQAGRGVVVLIREPLTIMLTEQRRRAGEDLELSSGELRDYGVGAQILIDLGVKEMVLLTNSKKSMVGLEGFGLKVVGQKPVPGRTKG